MKHYILLLVVMLGLVSQGSSVKKRLFFGDYSSSESSESSNSTDSDDWLLDPLMSIFGPVSTTSKRPAVAGTKIPITTTTSRPPIIKCSDKPTDPCPADCLTDSAVIHGFCCNCKHPTDPKVKPHYLCPDSTACPSNTTKLCDLFSRIMTCCCKNDFAPKPSPTPPSKPVQAPPAKPSPTPPMIPSPTSGKPSSTDPWPTPPSKPSPTSRKPSSTDPWPTPPSKPLPTSTTSSPSSTTTPSPSSTSASLPSSTPTPLPTSATTPLSTSQKPSEMNPSTTLPTNPTPTSQKPSEPSPLPTTPTIPTPTSQKPPDPLPTPPTSLAMSPDPLPTPPTAPTRPPSGDAPSSGKSQQQNIIVDIDSTSVQDEEVDLPYETVVRRLPRKLRHITGF